MTSASGSTFAPETLLEKDVAGPSAAAPGSADAHLSSPAPSSGAAAPAMAPSRSKRRAEAVAVTPDIVVAPKARRRTKRVAAASPVAKTDEVKPVSTAGAARKEPPPAFAPSLLNALLESGTKMPRSPFGQFAHQLWLLNPLHKVLPLDWMAITDSYLTVLGRASVEPERTRERLTALGTKLWQDASDTWIDWAANWFGTKPQQQLVVPEAKPEDQRFDTPEWRQNPIFRQLAKAYQAFSNYLIAEAERSDLSPEERRRLTFHIRQLVDATSPTLFLSTNPLAIKKAFETGGASLAEGWRNLLADIEAGSMSMTDVNAFLPGRNLATTPGKVVFRNRLIELIQYAPVTETTHAVPLLFVPPWINKFYILDLQPKNSMVRHMVEQGFTVFMISWKNPNSSMEDMTFEDYLREGPLAASDAVRRITGEDQINAVGYCIGGTLLSALLAALAAKGDRRFNAITLMVSLQDFSEVGDTAVFFNEPAIAFMEQQMLERGYLDSRHMSNMFNMLRANDLIWSTVVNNYLLGNKPPAFDLLYWNADSTRMTRAAHSFYLRNTYIENNFVKPGAVELLGESLDLSRIRQDIYAVGAEKDHIVPWKSAWRITQLAGGDVRFVLAASGHVAGMINPPAKGKGGHWVNSESSATAEAWLKRAQKIEGSWWSDWVRWLSLRSGEQVPPPPMGGDLFPPLCDSPGTYVLER